MTNTITTKEDGIKAAASIARDLADGRLSPADLEAAAVAELRELFGEVVPGGPCWPLQLQVARGVLAAGGIPADELQEWLSTQRASEKPEEPEKPLSGPEPSDPDLPAPAPVSLLNEELSPENDPLDADPEPQPEVETTPTAPVVKLPPRPAADGYDPMSGFAPGKTKRHL
jgi:hypothetical protein